MNVKEAVKAEFERLFRGRHEIDKLWILGDSESGDHSTLSLWVSECPGGAYNAFGRLAVNDNGCATLQLKTIWGIIRHQSRQTTHVFDFCNPDFPDNVVRLIHIAAANSNRAFRLAHSRSWSHYRRKHLASP